MQLDVASALARRLMIRHGLLDWTFVFDNAKTRAGACRPGRRQLGLSRPLTRLHSEDEVRDTILHEIAHALVGAQHGHDAVWARKAREIGCSAERCVSSSAPRVAGDWVGTCPSGHVVTRHRRPARVLSCQECSRRFDSAFMFAWTFRGRPGDLPAAYLAELAEIRRLDELLAANPVFEPPAPERSALAVLPVGTAVVIDGAWRPAEVTGRIFKRGRTRYEVLTARGVVSVPAISVRCR